MRSTVSLTLLAAALTPDSAFSQTHRRLITEPVNEARLHRLAGNTRHEATPANDTGIATDALPMEHMQLLLRRSPARQAAADQFVKDLHDKNSPSFHKWLTAAEFGARFGSAPEDAAAVTGWLESQGFKVNTVYSNG